MFSRPLALGVILHAGWVARFGSGLFLVIQMLILLDFTQAWNDAWVSAGEDDERWLYGLLGLTVAAYAGVLGLSGAQLVVVVVVELALHRPHTLCLTYHTLPQASQSPLTNTTGNKPPSIPKKHEVMRARTHTHTHGLSITPICLNPAGLFCLNLADILRPPVLLLQACRRWLVLAQCVFGHSRPAAVRWLLGPVCCPTRTAWQPVPICHNIAVRDVPHVQCAAE